MTCWVKVNHTFDGDFQKYTERRYCIFHISDVMFDRLLHDIAGIRTPLDKSFKDGVSIFQAVVETGNNGEFSEAEVFGWGFNTEIACWDVCVYHPSFDAVKLGEKLPGIPMWFQDGDVQFIKSRFDELRASL